MDHFFFIMAILSISGILSRRHPEILPYSLFLILFYLFDSFVDPILTQYGISMGQFFLWSGGILFVLILALKLFDYAAEKRREKNQINYEANYAKQKELYQRTGKVSNWDQEGKNLFDFEVKGSPSASPPYHGQAP